MRLGLAFALVTALFGLVPVSPAAAAKVLPASIVEFEHPTISSRPTQSPRIVAGPDGAMWFTNYDSIGRVTLDGTVTNYTYPAPPMQHRPVHIVAGPDGAMWYSASGIAGGIFRVTMGGTISKFEPETPVGGHDMAFGPDGALWMAAPSGNAGQGVVSRVTTGGSVTSWESPNLTGGSIAAGPDGQMWIVGQGGFNSVGVSKISMSGVATRVHPTLVGSDIVRGPDGAMWIANSLQMVRISPSGSITTTKKGALPGFALGPDGAFWSAGGPQIWRTTPSGKQHRYNAPRAPVGRFFIANSAAVDDRGNVWFFRQDNAPPYSSSSVGRINLKPRVTTTSLPNGKVGVAYSKVLTATDGLLPMKWKKVAPLPKGLKLVGKTGALTGIPKAAGTFAVTVQVKAKFTPGKPARTEDKSFSLTIVP